MVLVIVAGLQTLGSLRALPLVFGGDPDIPGTTPGGLLISATILLRPAVAIAGFVFALRGEIARAVMGVAGVSLLDWISFFPSFVTHWDASLLTFPGPFVFFVLPVCAPIAIVMAWRRVRPKLTVALGLAPAVFKTIMILAFAISIFIYGF